MNGKEVLNMIVGFIACLFVLMTGIAFSHFHHEDPPLMLIIYGVCASISAIFFFRYLLKMPKTELIFVYVACIVNISGILFGKVFNL